MTTVEQLVELQNGEPTTTSLQVAETFGKRHENVLKAIDNIIQMGLVNINEPLRNKAMAYFELSSYKNEQNHQTYRMYKMNYKGFTLLAGGFTDKKFMEYKVMFVEQFDHMQHYIQEHQQQQFFTPETVEMAAPKVMSILLDLPEEQLQIEHAHRYIYSAEEIGKRLGVDAYAIGIAAQKLDLKATRKEHQNRWSQNNLVGATSDDQKSRWMYTEEAFKEIKSYLEV